jgi:hypothetical protein
MAENTIYRCKHCKVQVVSKTNVKAVWGKSHSKTCPRRFK